MDRIEIDGWWRPTTNSRGQAITSTREGLIAFWAWFGGSQCVDHLGRPTVSYHGTRADFDTFDIGAEIAHPWLLGSDNKIGFFFTLHPGLKSDSGPWHGAAGYAGAYQKDGETLAYDGANIIPAYLALQMPYRMSAGEYREFATRPLLRDELEALGYDGIAVDDGTFVAFHPHQIKSTIGNAGLFDRDNPRITDCNAPPAWPVRRMKP